MNDTYNSIRDLLKLEIYDKEIANSIRDLLKLETSDKERENAIRDLLKLVSVNIMDDIFDAVSHINSIRGLLKVPAQKNIRCWKITFNTLLLNSSSNKLRNLNTKLRGLMDKKYGHYIKMIYLKSDLTRALNLHEQYTEKDEITKLILEKLCKLSELEYCCLNETLIKKLFFPTHFGIFCMEMEDFHIETVISFFNKQISEKKSKREQFQKRRENPGFSQAPSDVREKTDEVINQLNDEISWLEDICCLYDENIS